MSIQGTGAGRKLRDKPLSLCLDRPSDKGKLGFWRGLWWLLVRVLRREQVTGAERAATILRGWRCEVSVHTGHVSFLMQFSHSLLQWQKKYIITQCRDVAPIERWFQ
jgi:hypothetical protein